MTRCPFCQYDNEDGALFCEQCKSDLGLLDTGPSVVAVAADALENSTEATGAVATTAVPVANPVRSENLSAVAAAGPIPVARPVTRNAPTASYAEDSPTPVAESATESPQTRSSLATSSDTVGSMKTFIPQSGSHKLPGEKPVQDVPTPQSGPETRPSSPIARDTDVLPTGGKPALLVLRGQKISVEYPIYEGDNFIGRADEKPVDIDLEDQEPPDRIWSSRQHALIRSEEGILIIEDLNSSNGTFINRTRLYPGQKRVLNANDIIQIGTVQMKVIIH
jgi:pSer/pThr/pTyr-binding forkhead associated (FHA) protein